MRIVFRLYILLYLLSVLTSCSPLTGEGQPGNPSFQFVISTINFIAIAFLVYHFIVLKPQAREADEHKKFIDGLSKNDEVVTSGGIIGKVTQKKNDFISLEISQSVSVRVLPEHVHPLKKDGAETSSKKN